MHHVVNIPAARVKEFSGKVNFHAGIGKLCCGQYGGIEPEEGKCLAQDGVKRILFPGRHK
jgi:hypothetical protein